MISMLTFVFVFYEKIYTKTIDAKTLSRKIPQKLVLLAASGEREGIWEAQTQESYFPLFYFLMLFDFFPICMCDTKNIRILLKVKF